MTLTQTVQRKLAPQEIRAITILKEKNQRLYSIEYKLDLGFFNMTNGKVNHLLCWDENELVGYTAMLHFHPDELEVTMIAKPNKEILKKMNEAVLEFSKQRNIKKILVIMDHKDSFAKAYVMEMNKYKYSFSEYSMILVEDKFIPKPYDITLEPAKIEEAKAIAGLEEKTAEIMPLEPNDLKKTFVVRKDQQVIASIRVESAENSYGIYGFVVSSTFRGQGLGRKVISQLIQQLREKQVKKIYLEVESTNEVACHLYRSIGFEKQTLFDYYVYEQ